MTTSFKRPNSKHVSVVANKAGGSSSKTWLPKKIFQERRRRRLQKIHGSGMYMHESQKH